MARSSGLHLGGSRLCADACLPASSAQSISKIYLKIFVPVNDATTGLPCPWAAPRTAPPSATATAIGMKNGCVL